MIESKTIEVRENNKDRVIEDFGKFGWVLESENKVGKLKKKNPKYSITFKRDTEIDNYEKLNELFNEFNGSNTEFLALDDFKYKKITKKGIIFIILAAVLLYMGLYWLIVPLVGRFGLPNGKDLPDFALVIFIILSIVALGVSAILVVFAVKNVKKTKKEMAEKKHDDDKRKEDLLNKIEEIKDKAKNLM